jgi:hypothetical protein
LEDPADLGSPLSYAVEVLVAEDDQDLESAAGDRLLAARMRSSSQGWAVLKLSTAAWRYQVWLTSGSIGPGSQSGQRQRARMAPAGRVAGVLAVVAVLAAPAAGHQASWWQTGQRRRAALRSQRSWDLAVVSW